MNTYNNSTVLSIPINEAIKCGVAVDFSGAIAKNKKALGICTVDTDADDIAPVKFLGSVLALAGGAISKGDKVVTDTNGCMIKHTSEDYYEGYAAEDATAGSMFELLRGI
jgi:hypothetical protein